MEKMTDFFLWLQKLSQVEDSGVEVFIDENGEIEFELEEDVFLKIMERYVNETKNE